MLIILSNIYGLDALILTPFLSFQEASEALLHGYSTEELSQEMANLEGLMKDLSAITANQFNC